jgi:hypothetical protein
MKVAKALIALGVIGLAAYGYAQLTSLSSRLVGWEIGLVRPGHPGGGATPIYVRDWTVGLVGAIIGIILLGIGVYRLFRYRKA